MFRKGANRPKGQSIFLGDKSRVFELKAEKPTDG